MNNAACMITIKAKHCSVAVYYVSSHTEERIISLINQINRDIGHELKKNLYATDMMDLLTITMAKNVDDNVEIQFSNSIIFCSFNTVANKHRGDEYFRFIPYPHVSWIDSPWNLLVDNFEAGITILDVLIRMFNLPGLVCFDIDDIRNIFKNGVAIGIPFNEHESDNILPIINRVDLLVEIQDVNYFIIAPTPETDPLEKLHQIVHKTKLVLQVAEDTDLPYVTYLPSGTHQKNVLFLS